ncbi:MAG: hypothetical protein R6V21_06410, partial [Pelovirga sp.]
RTRAITDYLPWPHAQWGVFAFFCRLTKEWRLAVREPPVLTLVIAAKGGHKTDHPLIGIMSPEYP